LTRPDVAARNTKSRILPVGKKPQTANMQLEKEIAPSELAFLRPERGSETTARKKGGRSQISHGEADTGSFPGQKEKGGEKAIQRVLECLKRRKDKKDTPREKDL